MKENHEKEILLIDKPKGITSFDVIRKLRRKLGIRKMGHAGTLDPLASGLMIIGIEKGTKKLNEYLKLDKTYETHILLGIKTTTGDMEGDVIEENKLSCKDVSIKEIEKILDSMVGDIELEVPSYSAIKVKGKRLYKYAREGKSVLLPKKIMKIHSFVLNGISQNKLGCVINVNLDVGSGTYIRSISEEIGRKLGFPSTLYELRRIKIGDFNIEDAKTLDGL